MFFVYPYAPMASINPSTRTAISWTVALFICLGPLGCGPAQEAEHAPPALFLDAVPEVRRVVSLSTLASRFVIELGAGHILVGVDSESALLPELTAVPVTDFSEALSLSPDLVLISTAPTEGDPVADRLSTVGVAVVEFAPHDLEDVLELCRTLGPLLVGEARARSFEYRLSRSLAQIGGSSFGQPRPRVLGVVSVDPIVLAGGHSFETDLIEIAGGQSVTHGGEESRLEMKPEAWAAHAPDLALVMTSKTLTADERLVALDALPLDVRVKFFRVDADRFWLEEPEADAARLRAVIKSFARERDARAGRGA